MLDPLAGSDRGTAVFLHDDGHVGRVTAVSAPPG
jgi:hypothetical protein